MIKRLVYVGCFVVVTAVMAAAVTTGGGNPPAAPCCCCGQHKKSAMGSPTFTITKTATPTATITTPTNTPTQTPTPTPTATPNGLQGQMFLAGLSTTNVTPGLCGAVHGQVQANGINDPVIEKQIAIPIPKALRARVMYVYCVTAPGSGKTLTAQLRKNFAAISGASCSMANTNTCNVTLTNDSTADFAFEDYISWSLTQGTGSATASGCHATVYYRTSGDTAENDAVVLGGGNTGAGNNFTNANTYYCGPWVGAAFQASTSAWTCNSTGSSLGRWIFDSGSLSGFAINQNPAFTVVGSPRTDFTVQTADGGSNTDLVGFTAPQSLNIGRLLDGTASCSSNCAVADGGLVKLAGAMSGAGGGGTESNVVFTYGWSIGSSPAQFEGAIANTTINTDFVGQTVDTSITAGDIAHPIAKASTVKNLQCRSDANTHAQTFTVYTGSTIGGLAATAITCTTTATGGTGATCSDTTHTVDVAAGDYILFAFTEATAGTTNANAKCVVELAPLNTPVPTATATGTITQTPTPTSTSQSGSSTPNGNSAFGSVDSNGFNQNAMWPELSQTSFTREEVGVAAFGTNIGAGKTVTACSITLKTTGAAGCVQSKDGFGFSIGWYAAYASDSAWTVGDYQASPDVQTAYTTLTDIASTFPTNASPVTLTLTNCDANINKTGTTLIRMWIRGSSPTGLNFVKFSTNPGDVVLSLTYH